MTMPFPADRELSLIRLIAAPRLALYRCWTEPALLSQWFCPPPWTVPHAEMDVRPGGSSLVIMRGPNGEEMPNRGVYLDVVPGERLVFTDAFVRAWEPSERPFMTVILTFEDEAFEDDASQTRYTAKVRHWTVEAREQHERMGFHAGWGIATDQLAALAATL